MPLSNFDTSLDSFTRKVNKPGSTPGPYAIVADDINELQEAIENTQAKVGILGSAVTTSLDNLVSNTLKASDTNIQTVNSASTAMETNQQGSGDIVDFKGNGTSRFSLDADGIVNAKAVELTGETGFNIEGTRAAGGNNIAFLRVGEGATNLFRVGLYNFFKIDMFASLYMNGNQISNSPYWAISNSGLNIWKSPSSDAFGVLRGADGYSMTLDLGGITKSWLEVKDGMLKEATGDETLFDFSGTVNKAAGNYTGLKIDLTETSAPGTGNLLLDLQVGGNTVFNLDPDGVFAINSATAALTIEQSGTGEALVVKGPNNDEILFAYSDDVAKGFRVKVDSGGNVQIGNKHSTSNYMTFNQNNVGMSITGTVSFGSKITLSAGLMLDAGHIQGKNAYSSVFLNTMTTGGVVVGAANNTTREWSVPVFEMRVPARSIDANVPVSDVTGSTGNFFIEQHAVKLIKHDDTSPVTIFQIPAGSVVTRVYARVTEVFDGTTPSIEIGDGSDTDGFLPSASITETVTGLYGENDADGGAYLVSGDQRLSKYYNAATNITCTIAALGDDTTGEAEIHVFYQRIGLAI